MKKLLLIAGLSLFMLSCSSDSNESVTQQTVQLNKGGDETPKDVVLLMELLQYDNAEVLAEIQHYSDSSRPAYVHCIGSAISGGPKMGGVVFSGGQAYAFTYDPGNIAGTFSYHSISNASAGSFCTMYEGMQF